MTPWLALLGLPWLYVFIALAVRLAERRQLTAQVARRAAQRKQAERAEYAEYLAAWDRVRHAQCLAALKRLDP